MKTEDAFPYKVEPLEKRHKCSEFCCGIEELDQYFYKQIGQDKRKKLAAPFLLVDQEIAKIAGYYTLSATAINVGDLPEEISSKLPKYPLVPATLIGRLAIDKNYQGKKLGGYLLMDALYRSLKNEIASFAVVVDAKNDKAKTFYESYGFLQLLDHPNKFFIGMKTVEKKLGDK